MSTQVSLCHPVTIMRSIGYSICKQRVHTFTLSRLSLFCKPAARNGAPLTGILQKLTSSSNRVWFSVTIVSNALAPSSSKPFIHRFRYFIPQFSWKQNKRIEVKRYKKGKTKTTEVKRWNLCQVDQVRWIIQ